jgi:hypothetical protein
MTRWVCEGIAVSGKASAACPVLGMTHMLGIPSKIREQLH